MRLAVGFFVLLGFITDAFAQAAVIPSPDKFHVYLLMGQSNMAGRDQREGTRPLPSAAMRVLIMDENGSWVPLKEPIQHIGDQLGKAGIGPGTAFAIKIAEQNPNVTIGLVPLAVGGSALSAWEKDAPNYNRAVKYARLAAGGGGSLCCSVASR